MPNITSVLNDQIRRLAKREVKANTGVVRRATAQYRRDIAALKRQVSALTKTVAFLDRQEKRRVVEQPVAVPQVEDIRFRADGLKSHRRKLGISAQEYGKLVGVSGLTIYHWELGKARPRNKEQVAKVAAVRGLGKREALLKLELLGGSNGQAGGKRGGIKVSKRQPARGGQTAEELVLGLVKSRKATTSAQINAAWRKAGRPGKADNTLSKMVKAKELKRVKLKEERGSRYSVA